MTRQIRFEEDETTYKLIEGNTVFAIKKADLEFNTKKFYECFFENLIEKPKIEITASDQLTKDGKHVYDTVSALVQEACNQIDSAWFETTNESECDSEGSQ